MKKQRLLIINQRQFGYHSDTYYYCKHLCQRFDISYICWDYNVPRMVMDRIRVVYVSRKGNLTVRNLRFLRNAIKEIKKGYHISLIKYFRGCTLLRLACPCQRFLFDIRSGSVDTSRLQRKIYNKVMAMEARCFSHVSVISLSLARSLGLDKKAYILPIGSDIISGTRKHFNALYFLYIGTFHNRNMDMTIRGFARFYHEYKNRIPIHYTLVGSGYNNEEQKIRKLAGTLGVQDVVDIPGQIPHDRVKSFFDSHNIGISFIPKTEYFNVQPPTKTFEYLLSGMPVIATDTLENKAVISQDNGVLTPDTPDGFYKGLVQLYQSKDEFDSCTIRKNALPHSWARIATGLARRLSALSVKRQNYQQGRLPPIADIGEKMDVLPNRPNVKKGI